MIKVALTGSIGMGKSTVAAMFRDAGVPVFDADAEVRRLQSDDGPLLSEIESRFPGTVTDGRLDRDDLSRRVVADPNALAALEAIVHPAVAAARARFIAAHSDANAVLFDIPLLFETGGKRDYDRVIVVSAPDSVQRQRVLARPGMTEAKFAAIRARQMPDEEKRARADWLIDTGVDLAETKAEVERIIACLRDQAAR